MNLSVIIIVGIAAFAVIIFLVIKNQKDKKEVLDKLKNDYPQRKAGDEDIGVEEKM